MIVANKFINEKLKKILEDSFPPSNESGAVKKSFKRHRKKISFRKETYTNS